MNDITAVLAALEAAFNAHDAEAVAAAFTVDGRSVAVDGTQARGRDELLAALRADFAGPVGEQYARYTLVDTLEIDADTVLAQVDIVATDAAGAPIDVGHTATALHVLHRRGGRWLVAARQVTLVPGPSLAEVDGSWLTAGSG